VVAVKKILNKLSKDQQEYYIFLTKECFSGFSNAEDNFNVYRDAHVMHVHSSEFFWKALTVLPMISMFQRILMPPYTITSAGYC